MIIDLSNEQFKRLFDNPEFFLPIRWDGKDFSNTLNNLFESYINKFYSENYSKTLSNNHINVDIEKLQQVCSLVLKSVIHYLDGFPADAFETIDELMSLLIRTPLKIYNKSFNELLHNSSTQIEDPLKLYRVVGVKDNVCYDRSRVFHTPYTLRSKVSTSRYSIAGYPSLYLGTSLELCGEEINLNKNKEFALTSKFKIQRSINATDTQIDVIELAIKPQDFLNHETINNAARHRIVSQDVLNKVSTKEAYLLWYPVIAACSFIRVDKKDPFAAEYIIPQLLMQWIRKEMKTPFLSKDRLIGIRYFSCASAKASEMGFNYVFPTSGKQSPHHPYCPILMKVFKISSPQYIHEYMNVYDCQRYLEQDNDLQFIEF